jgi:Flp pilus assembly protein protease CpaA
MGNLIITFLLGALALLLVSAGIEDARHREIANWKNAAIAALAPLWWAANGLPVWPDMAIQLGVALLVFGFFAGCFAIGQMGGGDVKLAGALALWLPMQHLLWLVVLMSALGGALTMLMLGDQWVRERGMPKISQRTLVALGAGLAAVAVLAFGASSQIGETLVWMRSQPMLWTLLLMFLLSLVAIVMIALARAARKRGVLPETPYGVAIAIAGLLVLREPIFNHFG